MFSSQNLRIFQGSMSGGGLGATWERDMGFPCGTVKPYKEMRSPRGSCVKRM